MLVALRYVNTGKTIFAPGDVMLNHGLTEQQIERLEKMGAIRVDKDETVFAEAAEAAPARAAEEETIEEEVEEAPANDEKYDEFLEAPDASEAVVATPAKKSGKKGGKK